MSAPKRHHYVPQFYLRNFADEHERIWVYDRHMMRYRQQRVADTALISHYYRIETREGISSTEVEELLAQIESRACVSMIKLEQGLLLSEEERVDIAIFVALQITRVPDFEKHTNEMQEKTLRMINKQIFSSVETTRERIREIGDSGEEANAEELYKFVQEDKYHIAIPRQNNIRSMLQLASHAALYFMQMDWLLMRAAKGGSFITSDNPFTIFPPMGYDLDSFPGLAVGILTPGAKKSIPISPRTTLFMCDPGNRYTENIAPRDKVRIFNTVFARTSDRFIFSKDEDLLRFTVKRSAVDEIPVERDRIIIP